MKLYIAGPMRGIKDFNFPAFYEVERCLQMLGHEAFNPARRDEEKYGEYVTKSDTGSEAEAESKGFSLREALAADCKWIAEQADGIVVLPGWEASKGAQAETALGRALGLPIFTWPTFEKL